jgi:hypothetical protein
MKKFEILGQENYIPFIVDVEIQDYGQTVIIHCATTPEETKVYNVLFLNCEQIRWIFNESEKDCLENSVLNVLDFYVREKSNKLEITLITYVIELYLICKDINVEKNW